MKFSLIILVFSCIVIATCDTDYRWTGCEGMFRTGSDVCQQYGFGIYVGQTDPRGCGWDTEKVRCCKTSPSRPGCQWTRQCYGFLYDGDYACNKEFGAGMRKNDEIICNVKESSNYECCPV